MLDPEKYPQEALDSMSADELDTLQVSVRAELCTRGELIKNKISEIKQQIGL